MHHNNLTTGEAQCQFKVWDTVMLKYAFFHSHKNKNNVKNVKMRDLRRK